MAELPVHFRERQITVDGQVWGVKATNSFAGGAFGVPPRSPDSRWMVFCNERGHSRVVRIGLDDADHKEATEAQLLELFKEAE